MSSNFLNRELSWLEFNKRVLEEAFNETHPILERVKFLGISGSNLDEFFMVRVAGLKGQIDGDVKLTSIDNLLPEEIIDRVLLESKKLKKKQNNCWIKILENLKTVYEIVDKEKPTGIKGNFINSIYLTSTMGLSNKISIKSL